MTKIKKLSNVLKAGALTALAAPAAVFAVTPPTVEPLNLSGSQSLYDVALSIFNYALMFVGLIALAFLVWGGVQYVMAGGDDAKVTKARTTILNAVIGIVVVLISIGIINWIKNFINAAT